MNVTPVSMLILTLDFCGRTFGANPCLATGEPCYNTYPTCRYKSAYLRQTRDYKFTSNDAALPFRSGERPYIEKISYMPTEIKDNLTASARVKATLYDEPDTDIGIDPYVSQRSSVQGTYWKKLLARNKNYEGREARVYEGNLGDPEEEFRQTFIGRIENIKRGKGTVEVEIVDLLKALDKIEVPPKLDIKLVAAVDEAANEMTLTTVEGLKSPSGYIRMGDEIISYTGASAQANQLTGCQRGHFGTIAAGYGPGEKVQKVRYYAPANPFDILKQMLLEDAGYDAGSVDSDGFDYWRDWPGGEVDFSAVVSEPTKLKELYFEIVDLLDCKSWVGEDLKVTIRRNIPNEPGRSYREFSDEANIINGSSGVDDNKSSRVSRVLVYWDKSPIGELDSPGSYGRLDLAVDPDAESANSYGTAAEKKFFCRWLGTWYAQEETIASFIKDFAMRQVWRQRDPMPIVSFDAHLKDADAKTGENIRLSTDEVVEPDGSPLVRAPFQIIKREFKGKRIALRALRISPRKIDIIAPDDAPDWDQATEEDKEYGYICDDDGLMPDGSPGYHIY
ncbi:MAG: hypothetical protein QY316_00510 [Thermodesulfobacteriota bacterium]|nr:MAG: hypothetical protein QY316_00510 [Thermodesulfobacteriota bacterium]